MTARATSRGIPLPTLRRTWRLALPLTALLLTTGCTVTGSSEPELRGPLVAEDVVRLDLREPPTREEAGFEEGRNSLILERVGDAIDVELTLPTGILRTEAFGVNLLGPEGRGASGRRFEVGLNRRLPDLEAVRSELLEEADVLGLDPADVRSVVDGVDDPPSSTDNRVLTGSTDQPPQTSVEVRYSNAGGGWVLNYSFIFPASP